MKDTLDTGSEATFDLTRHAAERMPRRSIRQAAVQAALRYGREIYTRGAIVYGIGRKEADRHRPEGIDLDAFVGTQVVCSADGAILTVYRNRSFRGLRPGLGRRHGKKRRRLAA